MASPQAANQIRIGDQMLYRGQQAVVRMVGAQDVVLQYPDGQAVHYWLSDRDLQWIGWKAA
jgi:hypothetical protein